MVETTPGRYGGSWIHPNLLINLAEWLSTPFSIKVSKWVQQWRLYSKTNDEEFEKALQSIVPESGNRQEEKKIQMRMQKEMKGKIEVYTDVGKIDLLTDSEIIEIKHAAQWKSGVGQLLCYARYKPRNTKRLHLFGDCSYDCNDIESTCESLGIYVTYE